MKIQKKFFKIYIALFSVFGFFAFMGLYETTPIEIIESQITGRNPASLMSVMPLKATEILNVDCSEFAQEINVSAHQVRLEGYLCDKVPNPEEVYIQNVTTGKDATLFNRGPTRYMTDFIQLKEGKNQITLSYLMKDQTTRKVDLILVR